MSEKPEKLRFLKEELSERKSAHQFRKLNAAEPDLTSCSILKSGKKLINFCSNDYLGLASHPEVIKRSAEFLTKYGAGATASRLVSGNFTIHENLEQKITETFGYESALLFNTGFQANATVLATVANRNSLIIADKKVHNSLLQGAVLSRADFKRFPHNDMQSLESMLRSGRGKSYNRIWIITETLFSMDGDRNDLD
ncbi:MAG: aminotransferase class I/II-fold pyridoxal phosphate-dependent enzyme, partial [Balneolaceae bacterium]